MLINLGSGFLSLIPSPYAQRPEKRWLCTRRSSICWQKRVAEEALLLVMAPFRTEGVLTVLHRNDPHWPRLDSAVRATRLPELHVDPTRSCALCMNEHCMHMRWNFCDGRDSAVIDRETCSHAVSAHAVDFETKLETYRGGGGGGGGFIGNGEPPCVRAWLPFQKIGMLVGSEMFCLLWLDWM